MKKIETELKDCYILEQNKFGDDRGYFTVDYNKKEIEDLGLQFGEVVQTNRSKSSKGVLRGLHFQQNPKCQAKIVGVSRGKVIDVVVDLRRDSETYGKYIAVELSEENNKKLFVPRGFAHGFITLEDNTVFQYLVDNEYEPKLEAGILWNDKDLNIDWDRILFENYIDEPILSPKDKIHPTLKESNVIFKNEFKYLITGYNGQLGSEIKEHLLNEGVKEENILAVDINEMDITKEEQVLKVVKEFNPDTIFHCAAWTAVDKAEEPEFKDKCYDVNVNGTKNMVKAAKEVNAKIVYISTDYVFDGENKEEYKVDDKPNPKSVYGLTKFLGEEEVRKYENSFIIRTCGVFGIKGKNFVKTMLSLSTRDKITVVNDQKISPTSTKDLARVAYELSQTNKFGIYHCTNMGSCTWYEFASYILKDTNVEVLPVSTKEFYEPQYKQAEKENRKLYIAYRPKDSVLDKSKLESVGIELPRYWKDAVDEYIFELRQLENQKKLVK